jgi:hypothetical protein
LFAALRQPPGSAVSLTAFVGDVLENDDFQLSLYVCYELHYRGFAGVDPAWEWDPALLTVRAAMERQFDDALRGAVVVPAADSSNVESVVRALIDGGDGPSLSRWVEARGDLEHLAELAIHRSAYQLKEADPHTWAIPRLPAGRAKSALLRLQGDEYGNGQPHQSHAELFADTMGALGLDATYGEYLDAIPAVTLATVNLLSMFGLHRERIGACMGHLAVFEMTSVTPMTRYANAHRRVLGSDRGAAFYDVHVIADAEHEVIAIDELLPGLVDADPALAGDIVFGAAALMELERRFAEHVLARWEASATSLVADPLAAAS